MRRIGLWLTGGLFLWAQPPNDNCANALQLTIGGCRNNQTTQNATAQTGEPTACYTSSVGQSVWYWFQAGASDSVLRLTIDVTNSPNCSGTLVVYGPYTNAPSCMPTNGEAVHCERDFYGVNSGGSGSNSAYYHDIRVQPGHYYMVQVRGFSCPGPGDRFLNFNICLNRACNHCGSTCNSLCNYPFNTSPSVAWVTANCTPVNLNPPADSYSDVQHCFTFTAVNTTMTLASVVNSNCGTAQVFSLIYWLYSNTCNAIEGPINYFSDNTLTGLTVGQTYRICVRYEVATTSGGAPCSIADFYFATYAAPLPVVLASYEARCTGEGVELHWVTAAEENVRAFLIERAPLGSERYEPIATLPAQGGHALKSYRFVDAHPSYTHLWYRLSELTTEGNTVALGTQEISFCGKAAIHLLSTDEGIQVRFLQPEKGFYTLTFYDASGREMAKTEVSVEGDTQEAFIPLPFQSGPVLVLVHTPSGRIETYKLLR